MRFQFFIPVEDGGSLDVVHWDDSLKDFKEIIKHKREHETGFEDDRQCRVIFEGRGQDFWLSSLLDFSEEDFSSEWS